MISSTQKSNLQIGGSIAMVVGGITYIISKAYDNIPSPEYISIAEKTAQDVSKKLNTVYNPANGNGYILKINEGDKFRQITIRIMNSGGPNANYWRISTIQQGSVDIMGNFSNDPNMTHIPITGNSVEDILRVVQKLIDWLSQKYN